MVEFNALHENAVNSDEAVSNVYNSLSHHESALWWPPLGKVTQHSEVCFLTGGLMKSHSLPIQKVHQGPQHVVRVGFHLVLGVGVERTFNLVQQRRHLTRALADTSLEAEAKESGGSVCVCACV